MLRAARTFAVLATIAISISCQTVEEPFPPQASFNFAITDSAVATQAAPLPAPQVVFWGVEELTASNLTGFDGSYSFLFSGPCSYQLNALAPVPFVLSCGTSGLSLTTLAGPYTADLRVTLSRLELRAGARPDLSSTADPDGDGIPNSSDNCPIVYNPDQANSDLNQENFRVGDACSDLDTNNARTIPDQDLDGVRDAIDNCLWYPNPLLPGELTPPDTNRDGIGDACERIAPVVLLNGTLTLECDNVTFTAEPSKFAFFVMDFASPGVLTCDAGFTGCTINPSAVKLSSLGEARKFDCHAVP